MPDKLQKAIHNAVTGQVEMVDLTPEEIAEVEAKQARVKAEQETQAAQEQIKAEEAAADQAILAARPTDDDINNAKTIAELKTQMLKQNAVIAVLIKRVRRDS